MADLGACTPDDADPSGCTEQPGSGLTNTGPFSGLLPFHYWSGTELDSLVAWFLDFGFDGGGAQSNEGKSGSTFAWAVRSGDVPAVVPVPAAVWLFGSGLIGLISIARRKKAA